MQHQRMFRYCVAVVLLGAVLLVLGAPVGTLLPFAMVLACPLMMLLMMRGMHGGHGGHSDDQPAPGATEGQRR